MEVGDFEVLAEEFEGEAEEGLVLVRRLEVEVWRGTWEELTRIR